MTTISSKWDNAELNIMHNLSLLADKNTLNSLKLCLILCKKCFKDFGLVIQKRVVIKSVISCWLLSWKQNLMHPTFSDTTETQFITSGYQNKSI